MVSDSTSSIFPKTAILPGIQRLQTLFITTTVLYSLVAGCIVESQSDNSGNPATAHGADPVTEAPPGPLPRSERECNGHADLCNRAFNEVALPATHNSMSNEDEGWWGPNQQYGLTRQLQDGVRGLLLDTHEWQRELYLCHGNCLFGKLLLVEGLREIAVFLEGNPHEVMSIIFQNGISNDQTASAFEDSGLDQFIYTHDTDQGWPSLHEMIDHNERLQVTAEFGGGTPAWYQHAWDLYHDTPYSFSGVQEFNCDHNRGSPDNDLFLINHWVNNPLPNEASSVIANAASVLGDRVSQCMEETGSFPNMIAVDFYAVGDLFSVVDELNNPH